MLVRWQNSQRNQSSRSLQYGYSAVADWHKPARALFCVERDLRKLLSFPARIFKSLTSMRMTTGEHFSKTYGIAPYQHVCVEMRGEDLLTLIQHLRLVSLRVLFATLQNGVQFSIISESWRVPEAFE